MSWYLTVLKKYAVFTGRARRREYWMFTLVSLLVTLVARILDYVLSTSAIGWIMPVYALAVLLPTVGVTIRRLHDTDRSGWWILLGLVPVVGSIVLLVFLIQDGTTAANRYGPTPKVA